MPTDSILSAVSQLYIGIAKSFLVMYLGMLPCNRKKRINVIKNSMLIIGILKIGPTGCHFSKQYHKKDTFNDYTLILMY